MPVLREHRSRRSTCKRSHDHDAVPDRDSWHGSTEQRVQRSFLAATVCSPDNPIRLIQTEHGCVCATERGVSAIWVIADPPISRSARPPSCWACTGPRAYASRRPGRARAERHRDPRSIVCLGPTTRRWSRRRSEVRWQRGERWVRSTVFDLAQGPDRTAVADARGSHTWIRIRQGNRCTGRRSLREAGAVWWADATPEFGCRARPTRGYRHHAQPVDTARGRRVVGRSPLPPWPQAGPSASAATEPDPCAPARVMRQIRAQASFGRVPATHVALREGVASRAAHDERGRRGAEMMSQQPDALLDIDPGTPLLPRRPDDASPFRFAFSTTLGYAATSIRRLPARARRRRGMGELGPRSRTSHQFAAPLGYDRAVVPGDDCVEPARPQQRGHARFRRRGGNRCQLTNSMPAAHLAEAGPG